MADKRDNLKHFKPTGSKALANKPLCVKLPICLDQAVRSLPDTARWVRQVIEEAARAEGIYQGENDCDE